MNNIVRTIPFQHSHHQQSSLVKNSFTIWGNPTTAPGTSIIIDGKRNEACFRVPSDIRLIENNETKKVEKAYVSDSWNCAIRLLDVLNECVITIAGNIEIGFKDGIGKEARFDRLSGIEINKSNTILYICDFGNHVIRSIDLTSKDYMVSTLAGSSGKEGVGFIDGFGAKALFSSPISMTWVPNEKQTTITTTSTTLSGNITTKKEEEENLYISDFDNHAIRKLNVRTLEVTTIFKDTSEFTLMKGPFGIAIDKDGFIFVVDAPNHSIRKLTKEGVLHSTICGSPKEEGLVDGNSRTALLQKPRNILFDPQGNILFSQRNAIRMVTTTTGVGLNFVEESGSSIAFLNSSSPVKFENNITDSVSSNLDVKHTSSVDMTLVGMKRKREEEEGASIQPNKK